MGETDSATALQMEDYLLISNELRQIMVRASLLSLIVVMMVRSTFSAEPEDSRSPVALPTAVRVAISRYERVCEQNADREKKILRPKLLDLQKELATANNLESALAVKMIVEALPQQDPYSFVNDPHLPESAKAALGKYKSEVDKANEVERLKLKVTLEKAKATAVATDKIRLAIELDKLLEQHAVLSPAKPKEKPAMKSPAPEPAVVPTVSERELLKQLVAEEKVIPGNGPGNACLIAVNGNVFTVTSKEDLLAIPDGDWKVIELATLATRNFVKDDAATIGGCFGNVKSLSISMRNHKMEEMPADAVLATLLDLPQLENLAVGSMPNISAKEVDLIHRERPALKTLRISDATITPQMLESMSKFTMLQTIALANTSIKITPEEIGRLPSFPALEEFNLTVPRQFDPRFLCHIVRSPQLTHLTLNSVPLADATIDCLAANNMLKGLVLSGTFYTDERLSKIPVIPSLKSLEIFSTSISDASLPTLAKMTNLASLNLRVTKISERGKQQLRARLPNTRIP